MIRRDSSSNNMQVSSAVPASWMLVYLIFKGIAEDKIQKVAKQWTKSHKNEWPPKEVSFFKAFHTLYEELCVKVSRSFQWPDINQKEKEASVRDMQFVASEIVRIFEANQGKILHFGDSHQSDSYEKEVKAIYSNCKKIEKCLVWKEEYELYGQALHFEFFSDSFLCSLYKELKNCFFSNECRNERLSYDEFCAVLNLDDEIVQRKGDGDIEFIDYSHLRFFPVDDYGMLMYALIAFLYTKRNDECTKNPVLLYKNSDNGPIRLNGNIECDYDYVLADKYYWTSEFMKRVIWSDGYKVEEDLWKTAYYNGDLKDVVLGKNEVSEENSSALARIVHRKVFEEICSPGNLDAVVSSDFRDISASDYVYLWKEYGPDTPNSENRIKDLYHLLCRETKYFYQNIDHLSTVFMDKEDAEHLCILSREHIRLKEESDRAIEQLFRDTEGFDMELAYACLMDRCDFWDVALCQQLRVTSGMMRTYILNCISQDEKLKQFLLQKMEELSYMASIKTTDVEECWKISKLDELRKEGFIDSNKVIQGRRKHELLRILVKREYLKPEEGWRKALKEQLEKQNKSSKRPEREKQSKKSHLPTERVDGRWRIKRDVLMDDEKFKLFFSCFTALIDWDLFNKEFYQAGKDTPLTGKELKNDFNSNPQLGTDRKGEDYEVEIVRKLVLNNIDLE